jgi:putative ABC transport system substrate-binding protein
MFMVAILMLSLHTESDIIAAGAHGEPRIAILVSLKIRPYMDAVQGMEAYLQSQEGVRWDILFLDRDTLDQQLLRQIQNGNYSVLIAVGPEAMQYVWTGFPGPFPHKLFSMVMEPERIVANIDPSSGIALNLPASVQLSEFMRIFPELKRVGLIYDPANNQQFEKQASAAAAEYQLDLIRLKVDSRKNILKVFRSRLREIRALWMIPDATIITESIIPFIIKEAIANDIAVFGYNQYFIDSGAAASLVRRYGTIGRQTATKAMAFLRGDSRRPELPDYKIVINPEVFRAIGLAVPHLDASGKSSMALPTSPPTEDNR